MIPSNIHTMLHNKQSGKKNEKWLTQKITLSADFETPLFLAV